jgi:hypothetical protein
VFLLDKGVFTTIDPPGDLPLTSAFDLNDRGQIVGAAYDIVLVGSEEAPRVE